MASAGFIAIDWGTTNRRIYRIDAEGLVASERDGCGVSAMAGGSYAGEVARIRGRFGDLPVLCAGMVGSNRGWHAVPYLPCPAGLPELAARLHWVEPGRTAIVPGLSTVSDVMRGEEVQLLGAASAGLVPDDALLCQPGTHCKWARVTGGRVRDFRTSMTGELFALLRAHSLLADTIAGDSEDGAAFRAGLDAARNGRLLGDLFGIRAASLLGRRDDRDAASYASGLLIGTDVREQQLAAGEPVYLLANGDLARLYSAAIEAAGARPVPVDSHDAFLAGITALWRLTRAN